jgi:hypothetical protein
MKEVNIKLEIPNDITFDQIMACRETGGKFIVYEYLFPRPIFPPIKRISRIYYLKPGEKLNKYAFKYNLITLTIGWWGLPFGPAYTFSTIRHNKLGTDFTEDVLENLLKEDYEKRVITIKKISSIFIHPDNATLKEFSKSFKLYVENNFKLERNPFVGEYIATENPYYIIGLSDKDFENREEIKKILHKYFYTHTRFEFIKLADQNEISVKLLSQGVEIVFSFS